MHKHKNKSKNKRKQPEKSTEQSASFFAPLAHLNQQEQLKLKAKIVDQVRNAVQTEIRQRAKTRQYLEAEFKPEVQEIAHLEESAEYAYRNKCEFTFGQNRDGQDELGFVERVGLNEFLIHPIEANNPIVHPVIFELAQEVKQILLAEFAVYDREKRTGLLRTVGIRMGAEGVCSLVVQIYHDGSQDEMLEKFLAVYTRVTRAECRYVLFNQGLTDSFSGKPVCVTPQHPSIPMSILGLEFSVQPGSFFQTNTTACGMLYSLVADWAFKRADDAHGTEAVRPLLVLDVCCGVGTIGQVLAKKATEARRTAVKVVGVDIVEEAIEDARKNASVNFETSDAVQLEFVAGKAEDVVHKLIDENAKSLSNSEVICVVDPPRGGLHPSVVRCLRKTESIDRIIYVSCNWESLSRDLVTLCEFNSELADDPGVSAPFRCVRIQPVDMFPLTEHCEVLVELIRLR